MKKSYTSIEAVLHNLFVLHLDTFQFTVSDTPCSLSYYPQAFDFDSCLTSYILAAQDEVKLEFSSQIPLKLHKDMQTISDFSSFPIELQQALFEFIFENELRSFSSKIGLPLSFLTKPSDTDQTSYPFIFQLSIGDELLFLRMWINDNTAHFLMPKLKELPAKKRSLKPISLECSFLVGSMELDVDYVKNLCDGDVLLPDTLSHLNEEKHVFMKIFGNENSHKFEFNYLCSLNGMQMTLEQKMQIKEEDMSIEENSQMANDIQAEENSAPIQENIGMTQDELQNVPLNLTFELERRTMTLGEVEELHVGTNIMLSTDPLSPVTINISDIPYAKARIVEIDKGYGLQITEILMKQD